MNIELFVKRFLLRNVSNTALEKQPVIFFAIYHCCSLHDETILLARCVDFHNFFSPLTYLFGTYHCSGQGNGQRGGGWTWRCRGSSRGRRHGEAHCNAQHLRDTTECWCDASIAADSTTRRSQALQFSGRGCTGGTGLSVDTSQ